MQQYLLNMYQPDGAVPAPEFLAKVMERLGAINQEMVDAGAWVFTAALHPASSATVVSSRAGEVLVTDGPFAEGKEHLGGFWLINAPDLDAALAWADKIVQVTTLPIEVRPVQDRTRVAAGDLVGG